MTVSPVSKALLLSIRPRYTELILAGEKTVELRKRPPRVSAGTLVVMYASHPTCAIVGAFILEGIISHSPADLWTEHGSRTGVSKDVFERYYADRDQAFGLLVGDVMPLETEVTLAALRKRWSDFQPPQSYRYLHPARPREGLSLRFPGRVAYLELREAN